MISVSVMAAKWLMSQFVFHAVKALILPQNSQFTSGQYPTWSDISFRKATLIMYYCKRMTCLEVKTAYYIIQISAFTAEFRIYETVRIFNYKSLFATVIIFFRGKLSLKLDFCSLRRRMYCSAVGQKEWKSGEINYLSRTDID